MSDVASLPYQALRYLIRSTPNPEVTTNDLLQALLDGDAVMRAAFLEALSSLTEQDLRECRIEREAYVVDDVTGKQSYRDFLLTRGGRTPCIIETKVDSAFSSGDQAPRYLQQVDDGGVFVIVTRNVLARALAAQAGQQLGVLLQERNGIHRASIASRTVVVLSWGRLLRAVITGNGAPFEELLALDAALEGISDFTPFTAQVTDIASGRMVSQIVDVAENLCAQLDGRLAEADVEVDNLSRVQRNGRAVWVKVTILRHELWVGYDADYWATVPGDPDDEDSGGPTADPPSPFWIGRFTWQVPRASAAIVSERRQRLDRLGVTKPLRVALGASADAVTELLLDQAVVHLQRISQALHADHAAVQSSAVGIVEAADSDTDETAGR